MRPKRTSAARIPDAARIHTDCPLKRIIHFQNQGDAIPSLASPASMTTSGTGNPFIQQPKPLAETTLLPLSNNESPIIICGQARSGTTFLLRLLNSHPDIVLSQEHFLYKTPSTQSWFEEMESAFAGLKGRGTWPAKSAALMRSLWYLTSNDQTIESGQQARRWGNKTPGSEKYLDFYENIFQFCPRTVTCS